VATRISSRRSRRQTVGKSRLHPAPWIDPYPWVPGTLPEKMLFAELVFRRIYFVFQGDFTPQEKQLIPTLQVPGFKPDFLLPEYRVVLDPFGEFAHTQGDSIQRDRLKYVVYTGIGYSFYHPWASEITDRGAALFLDKVVELGRPPVQKLSPIDAAAKAQQGFRLGQYLGAGANSTAAGNKARAGRKLHVVSIRRGR
jgi:hypothetical protein